MPRQQPLDAQTLSPAIQAAIANVDPNVVNAVISVAQSLGVDPNLALATMMVESGGNPRAVGDGGTSFGLFQLHQGGELGSLTPQQAMDPATNARVSLSIFANVMSAHPNINPGTLAALAQRPADAQGYANKVNQVLGGQGGVVPSTGGGVPDPGVQTAQTQAGGTGLVWPFGTEASSQFERVDQGWDLQSTAGAPVYAIAAGTIGKANADPGGFGNDYPFETLAAAPQGAPSNTVYYGHIHVIPSLIGQQVQAGQVIGYTNTTQGQNGSAAPPGWLEIGFAEPGTGAPVQRGAEGSSTGAGQAMKSLLLGASVPAGTDAATGGPAPGAGSSTAGGPPTWNGQPLTMADVPSVDAYIRANWPSFAWLLTIPEVKQQLEQGAVKGWDTDRTMAGIEQTQWWQTTSNAYRQYAADKAQNPGDYTFTTPGSKASQQYAHIIDLATKAGVNLTPAQAQQLATNSLMYGWTDEQTQAAVGAAVNPSTGANAQSVMQQVNGAAGEQFQKLSPQVAASWAQNIAGGTQTLDQLKAQMASDAASKWTGYGPQLQQGMTMNQLTNGLRQNAATTMEVDPTTVDFVNNPMYSKVLDYVPANSPNGVHRVMTQSEMDAYLKSQSQWDTTQQARDQSAALATTLTQAFGKMG
jgi:hypothetical protein